MSEEATVVPQKETVHEAQPESPEPMEEAAEVSAETPEPEGQAEHPLEPNGKRFKQVWARAKHAEQERDRLREEAQREREERIRLEERLTVKEEAKAKGQPSEQEYTWDQLEQAIEAGQITRAWANTYREEVVAKKAREAALREVEERDKVKTRTLSVQQEIDRYKQIVPDIMRTGSDTRQKLEREYAYMVNVLGMPETKSTELAATRAALGDVTVLERTMKAKQSATQEPFVETHSSGKRPPSQKRLVDSLDERQKAHYTKMIDRGRYANWDEVEAELKWERPNLGARRG